VAVHRRPNFLKTVIINRKAVAHHFLKEFLAGGAPHNHILLFI
jgi:hypothetical protein